MAHSQLPVPLLTSGGYAPPLSDAILQFKYGGRVELAEVFAQRLARAWTPGSAIQLVPVPLNPLRAAERGYNQAALLCRELARRWRCRTVFPLYRRGSAGDSSQLGARARWDRVVREVHAKPAQRLVGDYAIVDDVVTSGATALRCAQEIVRCGGKVVAVLAVARAGPPV